MMKSLRELIAVEFKLFLREPMAVFFSLLFPILLLLVLGTAFGSYPAMPGFRVIDLITAGVIAMVIGHLGLMGIPIAISEYREQGVLKRYRVSPLPLRNLVLSHVSVQFALLLIVSLLIVIVAELVFDIRFDGNLGLVVLAITISAFSMFTLGFAIVGIFSSPRTVQAVGSAIFFVMLFTSGAAIPRREFPAWLQKVTDYVPLTHVVELLQGLWIGEPLRAQWVALTVLLGIAIAAFLVARLTYQMREFG